MKRVLVVDDEPDVKALIQQVFRSRIKAGEFSFEFSENGLVALEKLKSDPLIDIVFTDINMPVMDGLMLLEKIREHNILSKAVVISAYGDLQNIRTAMNRGAFDFITKPIDFNDIGTTLDKAVREMEILKKGIEARNNYERVQKEKEKLILEQNEMLEQQVIERTHEINRQKELIEVKNREILDSIYYAKKMQDAILPPGSELKSFMPESFVLYLPKDIVSGDFYWFDKTGDHFWIAIADCTGHGVAGAFTSMIGISILNNIISEKLAAEPSEVLSRLHHSLVSSLKKTETDSHVGMEIGICRIDAAKKEMHYAGARRPLIKSTPAGIETIAPDKFPIGGWHNTGQVSFTNHVIPLKGDETFYLFTDGYADQFGGESGKKLMTATLREILAGLKTMSLDKQKQHLEKYFFDWKGNNEQVDDVLIIGFRPTALSA